MISEDSSAHSLNSNTFVPVLSQADPDSSSEDEESEGEPETGGRAPYKRQNAHTVPGSTTASRKVSAKTRPQSTNATTKSKRKKEAPLKMMHASLLEALEKVKHVEVVGEIPLTTGLQVRLPPASLLADSSLVPEGARAVLRSSSFSPERDQVARGRPLTTLETTRGQIDGFANQLPFKCYLPEVASVGD